MYNPNYPAQGIKLRSGEMRANFNGLKDLIDALAALAVSGALVESVGTGNAGDPASVGVSLVNGVLRFSFVLPRGDPGPAGQDGQPGQNGQDGQDGQAGPAGPPFANALVDGVTTLNPGDNATVSLSFDGTNVHFSFGIPRGNDGSQGIQGFQGPPGEVTNNDLNNAINGTSSNSNAVSTLSGSYADPDAEELRVKMNELIAALRR